MRIRISLVAATLVTILLSGCTGSLDAGRQPFRGEWKSTKKVRGKVLYSQKFVVISDGWRFRVEQTLELSGKTTVTVYDGLTVTVDGRSMEVKIDSPENTLEAFWWKPRGQKKPGGGTICGRPVEIFEDVVKTDQVEQVQTYHVDRETAYVLRMREVHSMNGQVVGEEIQECLSIRYGPVDPAAFKAVP